MKKTIILFALLALLLPASINAAALGTCTQAVTDIPDNIVFPPMKVLTFTCTASADDASFPATATSTETTARIAGYYLIEARTNPGATAPQALYDIVLNDTDGIDLMGGTLANRSATASERAIPALATGIYGGTSVDGILTLAITGNNVNSAVTVVKFFLAR